MTCHYCPLPAVHRHHIVREQHLSDEQAKDSRNLIPVCWHDHQRLHSGGPNALRETEADLPDGFWSFVAENDLYGKLPRHLRTDASWQRVEREAA